MQTKHLNADKMQTNRKERMGDFIWRVSDCEELVGVYYRRWCDRDASRPIIGKPKRAGLDYWCFNSLSISFKLYWQKTVAVMLSLVCSLPFFVHDPPVCGQCIVTSLQVPVQLHDAPAAVGHQISIFLQPRCPVALQLMEYVLPDVIFSANTTLFW